MWIRENQCLQRVPDNFVGQINPLPVGYKSKPEERVIAMRSELTDLDLDDCLDESPRVLSNGVDA